MADSLQTQTKTLAQPVNHRKCCFLCNFNVSNSYYCKIWSNRKGSEFQMKRRIELLIDEELPLSSFPTNFMCKNCTNSIEKLEELEEFKKKLKERILAALGPRLNKKRKRKDVDHDPSPSIQVCEGITKVKVESQSDVKCETKIENGDRKEQLSDSVESQDLEENLGLQFKMEMEVSEHELIPEYEESEKVISPWEEVTVDDSDIRETDDSETNGKAQDRDVPESGGKNSEEDAKLIDDMKKGKLPPMLLIKGPNQSQFVLMPSSSSNMACPPFSVEGQSLLQSNQKSVVRGSDASKSASKSLTSLPVKINPTTSLIPIELPGGQKCLIAPTNVCLAPMTPAGLSKPKYSSATLSTVSVNDSASSPPGRAHFIQSSKFKSILPKNSQSVPTTSVQTKPVKTIVQIGNLGHMALQQNKRKQLLNGSSKPNVRNSKGITGKQIPTQAKPPMVVMGQKSVLLAPSNVKEIAQDSVVRSTSSTIPSQIATTATTTATTTTLVANNSVVLKVPIILDKCSKPKIKHNDYTQMSKLSPVALMTKSPSSVIGTSSTISSATSTTNSLTTPLVIKGGSLMLNTSENGNFPVVAGKGKFKHSLSSLVSAKKATSCANTENGMNTSASESSNDIVVTIQKNLETNEHQKLSKMMSRMNYLECKLAKAKQEIKSFKLNSAKKLPDHHVQRLKLKKEKGKKVTPATQSFLVASRVNAPGQAQQPSLLIPLVNNSGLNCTTSSQIADVMVNHDNRRSSPPLITSDLMSTVESKTEAEWGDETKALRDNKLFMEEPLCHELKTEPIDNVPEIEFEEEEITDSVGIT